MTQTNNDKIGATKPARESAPRRTRSRQPQVDRPSNPLKAAQREEAAYCRLLKRPDVKEALFNLENAQLRRDSVSRKLCGGSSAVSVGDLSRLETDLCVAKANLKVLADQLPLLQKHPKVAGILADQL